MPAMGEQVLLRVYLLTTDQAHFAPAYERLVQGAARRKMAGATVLKGIYGFGSRGIQNLRGWHLAHATPVIVEMVDAPERIAAFIHEEVHGIIPHGMITLERAGVLMYRRRAAEDPRARLDLLGRVADLSTIPMIDRRKQMKSNEEGILLRVFAGESDEVHGQPLYEAIVHKARDLGLSGATVLRGSMGFGANSILHTAKVLELSTDLPIVIELVDSEENIRKLLPHLDTMVKEGMITMESVRIVLYRHNPDDAPPAGEAAEKMV